MRAAAIVFGVVAACSSKPSTPKPTQCEGAPPAADYTCLQDCGPPVVRDTDPPPPWRWRSPAEVLERERNGCPRCLPPEARIATPDGDRAVASLSVGARVLTVDGTGRRVEARVLRIGSTPVDGAHSMMRIVLADGRVVTASAGHPLGDGRTFRDLHAGAMLGSTAVTEIATVPFTGDRTWDLLPSGPTGLYIADGVVLGSTLEIR